MDDQFGGRTDDDLFADDYEPVPEDQQIITAPAPAPPSPPPAQDAPAPVSAPAAPQGPAAPLQAPKFLAQSRHNRPDKPPRGPSSQNNHHNNRQHSKPAATTEAIPSQQQQPQQNQQQQTPPPTSTSPPPPSAPKEPAAARSGDPSSSTQVGRNTASVNSESRIGSGVNPRTKLTDEELAAKMEKMRILAAEKTRKFEQAQRDESEHAVAYARGMEEARKRKAEEAARRRAADEDRKRLEDERAKNRERKLKAMGMKEGGSWDEGKEERLVEEERRGFRGANGGVRGVRGGGGGGGGNVGLGGSRFATARDGDGYGDGVAGGGYRGRGGSRGRGGRGGGRGGRALFDADGEDRERDRDGGATSGYSHAQNEQRTKEAKPSLAAEDFPALPGSAGGATTAPKIETKAAVGSYAKPVVFSPLSPIGRWDDEVAAMDAKSKEEQ